MIPAPFNFTMKRGDTFEIFLRMKEMVLVGTEYVEGDYVNLTDWVGLMQVRQSEDAPEIDATFDIVIADQGVVLGGFFIRMSAATSAALTIATGKYDLQFTLPDDSVFTYLSGVVTLSKDVSKVVV
jgi:hypothetical protein